MKIFVDSDVVISSLLSSTGASFLLLNQISKLELFISNISVLELEIVAHRLQISTKALQSLIVERFSIIELKSSIDAIKREFSEYVLDIDDAHIVAGAKESASRFLITYNVADFKIEPIKEDFRIIILTPGQFLQYFRSLK